MKSQIEMVELLKQCIFDPMWIKPKCVWEAVVYAVYRPLVFNTICIFITFEKYLYWVFSIHLRKNVFVLINTFLPASILFVSILFMNNFFVKSIKIESLSYQITLINLSYSNKNKEKFIHILEFEFW